MFPFERGKLKKLTKCGVFGILQVFKTVLDDSSVLAVERDYIGNCTDSTDVNILLKHCIIVSVIKCSTKLEGNTYAAQVFIRRRAIRAVRIYYSDRFGQHLGHLMVIGNNELHTKLFYKLCFFDR